MVFDTRVSAGKREHTAVRGYGRLIRAARDTRGWTRAELAERINQSRSTVERLEAEETEPSVEQINALTLHLGISPAELLEAMGVRLDVGRSARMPRQLVEDYQALEPRTQQMVTEIVHGLRQGQEGSE